MKKYAHLKSLPKTEHPDKTPKMEPKCVIYCRKVLVRNQFDFVYCTSFTVHVIYKFLSASFYDCWDAPQYNGQR